MYFKEVSTRVIRCLVPASVLGASFLLPQPILSQPTPQDPRAQAALSVPAVTKNDLVAIAARVMRGSPALSQVWPGYWPETQPFVIYAKEVGALLVNSTSRPASFAPVAPELLPRELVGRAFFHEGTLPEVRRPFIIGYPLGEGQNAILVNAEEDAEKTIALLLHEQFHGYQNGAFQGRERQFVSPAAIADRVVFAATAETERSILAAALSAQSTQQRQELLETYFGLRRDRERTMPPDVVRVEQGFERSEGTAEYAERAGVAAIEGAGDARLRALLVQELQKNVALETGAFATQWFRSRSYGTGAALTYLISQLDGGDWRRKIEGGAKPDELLESLVGRPHPRRAATLAARARERFGYEQHRLRLEPIIRAAEQREIKSVPEFLALGAHQVVLEAGAAGKGAKPGFSAIGMTVLGPTTTALQKALTFNVATPALSLTVRDRPVLLEPDSRYTVLLPGVPRINGSAALAPGTHSFATLSLEAEGYELKVEVPATVSIEPGRTVVRLQ